MLQLNILNFFIENPYQEVYLRELAKKLKISPFAAKKYLDILKKENLIVEEKKANLRYFKANINNLFFKHLKIAFNINTIEKSGLINYIKDNVANISSIVLFGSMAKGENDQKSDIDILIIGSGKKLNINKFKEKLSREISLHIFTWSEWNKKAKQDSPFYYESAISGVPLYGELPIIKNKK